MGETVVGTAGEDEFVLFPGIQQRNAHDGHHVEEEMGEIGQGEDESVVAGAEDQPLPYPKDYRGDE